MFFSYLDLDVYYVAKTRPLLCMSGACACGYRAVLIQNRLKTEAEAKAKASLRAHPLLLALRERTPLFPHSYSAVGLKKQN